MPYLPNLTVRVEQAYGMRRIYPACETSRDLLALSGDKTFSEYQINRLKKMGFTFEAVQTSPTEI